MIFGVFKNVKKMYYGNGMQTTFFDRSQMVAEEAAIQKFLMTLVMN